ncbi:hypothetical protein ACWEPZ_02975 [Streptomyces sp. NPDC004288]
MSGWAWLACYLAASLITTTAACRAAHILKHPRRRPRMSQPETPSPDNPYAHIDDHEPPEQPVEKVVTTGEYL